MVCGPWRLKNATRSLICVWRFINVAMVPYKNMTYSVSQKKKKQKGTWLIVTFIKNSSLMFNPLLVLGGFLSTTGIWKFSLPRWGNSLSTFKTITPWLLVPAKVLSDGDSNFAWFVELCLCHIKLYNLCHNSSMW